MTCLPLRDCVQVSIAFPGRDEPALRSVSLRVGAGETLALVGPSGAGKSTLLKLMLQEIEPSEGEIRRNPHLRFGRYNQHSEDVLDLEKDPLNFLRDLFADGVVTTEGKKKWDVPEWRAKVRRCNPCRCT